MNELLFITLFISLLYSVARSENACASRCARLHSRSLQRIGFDQQMVTSLFEKQRPLGTMKDVCWRIYDHMDCMRRCPADREHEKDARKARFKCKFVMKDIEEQLQCISRFHSFIEVKCSTFLKEAVRLRQELSSDSTPDKDSCRFLHLNALCLENSVQSFCPQAKKIFRRLNFRDYFLSFILPEEDSVLDDVDLDSCQIYDFVKKTKESQGDDIEMELTTIINRLESSGSTVASFVMNTKTPPAVDEATTQRQEFTSLLNELLSSSEEFEEEDDDDKTMTLPGKITSRNEVTSPPPMTSSSQVTSLSHIPHVPISSAELSTTEKTVTPLVDSRSSELTNDVTIHSLDEVTSSPRMTSSLPESSSAVTSLPIRPTAITVADTTVLLLPPAPTVSVRVLDSQTGSVSTSSFDYHKQSSTPHSTVVTSVITPTTAASVQTTKGDGATASTPRRVFSDDSMEYTPPNFGYSSQRARHYTTRFDHEIVTPVVLDTSTMFGLEEGAGLVGEDTELLTKSAKVHGVGGEGDESEEEEHSDVIKPLVVTSVTSTERIASVPMSTTESSINDGEVNQDEVGVFSQNETTNQRAAGPVTPLLSGGVVVKQILSWNQKEMEGDDRTSDVVHRSSGPIRIEEDGEESLEDNPEEVYNDVTGLDNYEDDVTEMDDIISDDDDSWDSGNSHTSDKSYGWDQPEVLLFIYLLLFSIAFLALVFTLICCIWCRRTSSYEVTKY